MRRVPYRPICVLPDALYPKWEQRIARGDQFIAQGMKAVIPGLK